MPVDTEVANESSQQTRTGNGNCIKVLILGVVVGVLGLTTVLVCLRLSKSNLPTKRVDTMSSEGLLNSALKDDFPIINEADILDKVDNMVEEVQENVQDLAESESSIEILKEVLGNMKEIISNDIDDPLEPFIETEVLENEMPTPRMIDLDVETERGLSTAAGEVFDDDTDQNVPEAFLGEGSEEMSENPTLEEISKIVKKIIQSYKEKDDLLGFADDNADGTPTFTGEVDAAGTENIVGGVNPISATHNNHDDRSTNSNHDGHFVLSGHRGSGSKLDKIGDHVFPIRSEDNIHDDFAQRRGMGPEDANQHLNSRFPNSFTHSDIPQLPSHNSSVPPQDGNLLMEKFDDVKETTTRKVVAMTTLPIDTTVAVGSHPNVTSNKAVGIKFLQSETIGKALATDPPLIETANKAGAIESPPNETSNNAVAIESLPIETPNIAGAIEYPPIENTKNTAVAIKPPLRETVHKAVAIESPPIGTTHKAVAIESRSPIATTHKAGAIDPSLWLLMSL